MKKLRQYFGAVTDRSTRQAAERRDHEYRQRVALLRKKFNVPEREAQIETPLEETHAS
jgi:hypothetical protein